MKYASAPITMLASPFLVMVFLGSSVAAQGFVEYPGHNTVYGSHTIMNSTWDGGPAGVTVSLDSDGTLHEDGMGFSQRTARNTLNYTSPSSIANPQNYDNLRLVGRYGSRLPLLQQLSGSGASTLTYQFDQGVNEALDLFITDVDQSDSVSVSAFDFAGNALDMSLWVLADEGDLSLYKDTGTDASMIVAPTPSTEFVSDEITLEAIDATNYNRSFSILRTLADQDIGRIEITFQGTNNSPNRASGGNGSHIYVALTIAIPEPGSVFLVTGLAMLSVMRRRRSDVS